MKLRTCVSLLLILCLLFACCGCGGQKTPDETASQHGGAQTPEKAQTMNLLCCGNDTLNPYTSVTKTNQELTGLLFDPLIKLDNTFQPVYVIAASSKVEDKTCTVTLRQVKFTDGSAVTAADVVASFRAAKACARYAAQLTEILSATADGSNVRFALSKHDPYAANLLDFPVYKQGSETRVNGDNVALAPIGSGRYTVDDAKTILTANPSYAGGKVSIGVIYLTDTPDDESVAHNVEVGSTDLYYTDISDGQIIRMSAKRADVPLNHLVYLGMNLKRAPLNDPDLRYAISSAVDRAAIADTAYFQNATPAAGPFPAVWADAKGYQSLQEHANTEIALVNLDQTGYNKKDAAGFRTDAAGKRLTLRLLYNKENQSRKTAAELLVNQLAEIGISVTLDAQPFAAYTAALQAGNFDLYLAEVKLCNNMDLGPLITPGGSVAYGIAATTSAPAKTDKAAQNTASRDTSSDVASDSNSSDTASGADEPPLYTAAEAVAGFYAGQYTLGDLINAFLTEMPLIPLCHRNGILFYDTDIEPVPAASVSDIFFSIETLTRNR